MNKYHARRTQGIHGIWFRSVSEASYAQELELRRHAADPHERVETWAYEVTFYLPTIHHKPQYVKHVVDFWVRWGDGRDCLVEVKGKDTPAGRVKRLWLETYLSEPITVIWV